MKISLDGPGGLHYIRAYRPGEVVINEQRFHRSLVVSGNDLHADWAPDHIEQLTAADLEPVLAMRAEVVLLGTGERLVFPTPEITARFGRQGIGIEVMDTGAACRTYNVLVSEGRAVVAALIVEPGRGNPE